MSNFEFIRDVPRAGAHNMRIDSELLDRCARGEITGAVRLYGFSPPCLSLGRLQPMSDVNVEACDRDGIEVVRRPSGGRSVLHDQEVTYALVCRVSDAHFGGRVLESCARIHRAVALGLAVLGVPTVARAVPRDMRADARHAAAVADCFARPSAHELLDKHGHKVAGSAQARRGGALLQHGSVLLEPPRAARYLLGAVVAPLTGGVRAILQRELHRDQLASALEAGFRRVLAERPDAIVAPLDTPA